MYPFYETEDKILLYVFTGQTVCAAAANDRDVWRIVKIVTACTAIAGPIKT